MGCAAGYLVFAFQIFGWVGLIGSRSTCRIGWSRAGEILALVGLVGTGTLTLFSAHAHTHCALTSGMTGTILLLAILANINAELNHQPAHQYFADAV